MSPYQGSEWRLGEWACRAPETSQMTTEAKM